MHNSTEIYHNGITFTVAYATELLGVISILCEDQEAICDAGAEWGNGPYRNEVLSRFSAWRGSEVTKMLEKLSDDYNFNYDAPVELFLQRTHGIPLDLDALCRHRKEIPQPRMDRFLHLVSRFEEESGFQAFYDAHRQQYEAVIRHFITDYDLFRPLDFLTDYLEIASENNYCVNFMMGITNSNYGVTVGKHIYANLCPEPGDRFSPLPDYSGSTIYWTTLIVHEFAHSFINPAVAKYSDRIRRIDLAPYRDILKEMMYGESLETYIIETIIRAIECLYVERRFPAAHEEYVQVYEQEGFVRIRQIEEQLRRKGGMPDIEKLIGKFYTGS